MLKNKKIRFHGKYVTVYTYDQQMPDKSFQEFEVWEDGPYVKFFVFDEQKRILVVREYRHTTQQMELRIPGAGVMRGETPEEAVVRECQEELGFKPLNIQQYHCVDKGYQEDRKPHDYAFICSDLIPSKLPHDKGEQIEVVPMELDEVEKLIWDGKFGNDDWRGIIFLRIKRDLEKGIITL